MRLNYYLTIVCINIAAILPAQTAKYSVKVTENPFQFEIIKKGDTKPFLLMDNSITLQHFTNSIIEEKSPYMVCTDGLSDKKQKVDRAKLLSKNDNHLAMSRFKK